MEVISNVVGIIIIVLALLIGTGIFFKMRYIYFGNIAMGMLSAWLSCVIGTAAVLWAIFLFASMAVIAVITFIVTHWMEILGIIVLLIGGAIWGGWFEPANSENENENTGESHKTKRTGIIVCCVGGVFLLMGIFGHGTKEVPNKMTVNTTQQTTQNLNTGNTAPKSTVDDSKKILMGYVNQKDQYDKEISAVVKDVNEYLQSHSNFKDEKGLSDRTKVLFQNIRMTQNKLKQENIPNQELKLKLNEVLNLEVLRIGAIGDGIFMNKENPSNDYKINFKSGTEAAYKYDEANAEFNRLWQQSK